MALARWIGGTFLVASLALFPVALVAEVALRKHHPWKTHLLMAAGVALVIGALIGAAAWLGIGFPRLGRRGDLTAPPPRPPATS
jgi:apolipoprotein N-acyltransferase